MLLDMHEASKWPQNELQNCTSNFECNNPNPVVMGCCPSDPSDPNSQKYCYEYTESLCTEIENRPLDAYCTENKQCGDSCCGQDSGKCVAPLLDCKGQLPIWAFSTIILSLFTFLFIFWKVLDHKEKQYKRKKKEESDATKATEETEQRSDKSERASRKKSRTREQKIGQSMEFPNREDMRVSGNFGGVDAPLL